MPAHPTPPPASAPHGADARAHRHRPAATRTVDFCPQHRERAPAAARGDVLMFDDPVTAVREALGRLLAQGHTTTLHLDAMAAWALLGQLQLALRHPGNRGPSSQIARGIAAQVEAQVAAAEPLRTIAAWGWDPTRDVPRADPDAEEA